MKKTWVEKLADKATLPKVLQLEAGFPCYKAVHKMGAEIGEPIILVNAGEIIPIMASVPLGKIITIREICLGLAKQHAVKGCCSLTSGIFIMTIANAVEEARAANIDDALAVIPYWRTLKAEGFLNEKFPGGQDGHKQKLEAEGFRIKGRGRKYQVADWDKHLLIL